MKLDVKPPVVYLTPSIKKSKYFYFYFQVSSLGSGTDHVMDAIAECEQIVRSKGQQEEDAPWRLYFRKELFSPWNDAFDEYAHVLVFNQLVKGLRTREYRVKVSSFFGMMHLMNMLMSLSSINLSKG